MEQHYKIGSEGLKIIRKKLFSKFLPMMLIICSIVIGTTFYEYSSETLSSIIFAFFIAIGFAVFASFRAVKKQTAMLSTYSLTVSDSGLTRSLGALQTVSIPFNEITEISKLTNGSLCVKAATKQLIGIPAQIEDFPKLEALLGMQREILQKNKPPFYKSPLFLLLLFIALGVAATISQNEITAIVAGVLFVSLQGYFFYILSPNKTLDPKMRKLRWWVLLLAAVVVFTILLNFNYIKP
jgi:hypothetical protein